MQLLCSSNVYVDNCSTALVLEFPDELFLLPQMPSARPMAMLPVQRMGMLLQSQILLQSQTPQRMPQTTSPWLMSQR